MASSRASPKYAGRYKPATHNNLALLKLEYPGMAKKLEKNFWAKTERVTEGPDAGCLKWTAMIGTDGYGKFGFFYRTDRAHRVAWVLHYGDLDRDEHIGHRCGNRWCVEISHLVSKTQLLAEQNKEVEELRKVVVLDPEDGVGRRLSETNRALILKHSTLPMGVLANVFGVCEPTVIKVFADTSAEKPRSIPTPSREFTRTRLRKDKTRLTITPEFRTRFMERLVSTASGCHEWQGSIGQNGYGRVTVPGQHQWTAHRVAWTLKYGEIPEGLRVLHKCDNRPCCNPEHLFLGTDSDNMNDMYQKGRHQKLSPQVKLTKEERLEAAKEFVAGRDVDVVAKKFGITAMYVRALANRLLGHRIYKKNPRPSFGGCVIPETS